jgi:hypothetical protein
METYFTALLSTTFCYCNLWCIQKSERWGIVTFRYGMSPHGYDVSSHANLVCRWATNLVAQHAVIRSQQERLCSQHIALTVVTILTTSRDNVFGAVTILLARFTRNSGSNASSPAGSSSYSAISGHGFPRG